MSWKAGLLTPPLSCMQHVCALFGFLVTRACAGVPEHSSVTAQRALVKLVWGAHEHAGPEHQDHTRRKNPRMWLECKGWRMRSLEKVTRIAWRNLNTPATDYHWHTRTTAFFREQEYQEWRIWYFTKAGELFIRIMLVYEEKLLVTIYGQTVEGYEGPLCLIPRSLIRIVTEQLVNFSVPCVCGVEMCSSLDEEYVKRSRWSELGRLRRR